MIISLGLDIGSLYSKAVLLEDQTVLNMKMLETTGNISDDIDCLIETTLEGKGMTEDNVNVCVATGRGADMVTSADFLEDDVSCISFAVNHYLPAVSMAIDMGGQSITTILLDPAGGVLDFMRNDKCASGSGRFIEVMSDALGVAIGEVDSVASKAKKPISISSQCGVFAESEIVSHVNEGEDVPGIIIGICESVAKIVISQAMRMSADADYTITGGVGRLSVMGDALEKRLRGTFYRMPVDSQYVAAAGAALIGYQEENEPF